jgi:hypothetical protein
LFIGALIVIDIAQIILEWLVIGLAINPFIDAFVGMSIPFYLYMRGEDMADKKRILGLVGSIVGELIPGVDEFPLWTLYGIYLFSLSRSDEILGKIPGADTVINSALAKKQSSQLSTGMVMDPNSIKMAGGKNSQTNESNKKTAIDNKKEEGDDVNITKPSKNIQQIKEFEDLKRRRAEEERKRTKPDTNLESEDDLDIAA